MLKYKFSLKHQVDVLTFKGPVYPIRRACGISNFLKPIIRHSHPLHAVIGQLCRGERGTSLAFFHSISVAIGQGNTTNVFKDRMSENVHPYPVDIVTKQKNVHSTFECGWLDLVQTSSMNHFPLPPSGSAPCRYCGVFVSELTVVKMFCILNKKP